MAVSRSKEERDELATLRSYLKFRRCGEGAGREAVPAYVVCRRYWSINLKEVRKLGTAQGGAYADGTRFQFAGGQIRSLLSLISYFGRGEMRERYLGVKIPPANLKPGIQPSQISVGPVRPDRAVPPLKGEACQPRTCDSQGRWRSCGAIRRSP